MEDRLDVIIFGATGFTGKYCVVEACKILKDLNWGIAGRSKEKLEQVLQNAEEKTKVDLSKIPIIIADVKDEQSILAMTQQCKVLVNCCGPYLFYGECVVKACINSGTHQVDVSGELQYIERMQLEYDDLARQNGVYIVSTCGFDSIPADMGTIFVENQFNGVVNSVESYLEATVEGPKTDGATLNYTTWESAVHTLARARELTKIRKKLFQEKLPSIKPKLKGRCVIHKASVVDKAYCLPFPGSDPWVVMRSQRILYKTDNKRPVQIKTYMAFRSLVEVIGVTFVGLMLAIFSRFSCSRRWLLTYPKFFTFGYFTHEGPSEERMRNTKFTMTFLAKGWSKERALAAPMDGKINPPNKQMIAKVTGFNPGYGGTCVGLLLSALTILKESDKMPSGGGVFPPGAAFSKTSLLSELVKYENGYHFEVVEEKEETEKY